MDMGSMFSLVDMLVVACGLYVIYLCIDMMRTREVKQNMLLPKGLDAKKCKDVEGYIHQLAPKQLVLGILALVCGVAGLLQDLAGLVNAYVYMGALILFFIYAVWYAVYMKKVIRKFW